MAVGVVQDFAGGTLDQYGQSSRKMGLSPGRDPNLFHWVAQTDDGVRITDVGQSREEFERFAQSRSDQSPAKSASPIRPKSPTSRSTTT